jgi:catechol 2,3-dioxygenase-like lactoylglutathione lyase family enzyme
MMSPSQVWTLDMMLEVIVIPVSNVDRAKQFYGRLGWRLDADFGFDDGFRVIQFTPPGSGASVIFGTNVTAAAPGPPADYTWSSPTSRLRARNCSAAT